MRQELPDWIRSIAYPLTSVTLGLALWQWIGLGVTAFAGLITYRVGRWAGRKAIRIRNRLTGNSLTEITERNIRRSCGLLAVYGACNPLLEELRLHGHAVDFTQGTLTAIVIIAVAMFVYAVWEAICDDIAARSAGSERAERLLVPMARKFVRAVIIVIGILVGAAEVFSADVRGILASLGIGGIVVALAAKDSVENVFGSITILFDMPFAIGDWVKIDKFDGVVEEINLRSTRLRTFEDTVINVPNANLIRACVENVSARRSRRQQILVRVSYDSPIASIDRFCEELRIWIKAHPKISEEKMIVDISEVTEPALVILIQCLFEVKTQAEELELRHELVIQILRARDNHDLFFSALPRSILPVRLTP